MRVNSNFIGFKNFFRITLDINIVLSGSERFQLRHQAGRHYSPIWASQGTAPPSMQNTIHWAAGPGSESVSSPLWFGLVSSPLWSRVFDQRWSLLVLPCSTLASLPNVSQLVKCSHCNALNWKGRVPKCVLKTEHYKRAGHALWEKWAWGLQKKDFNVGLDFYFQLQKEPFIPMHGPWKRLNI